MKRFAILAVILAMPVVASAQTSFPLGQPLVAFWSPVTNEAASQVNRYEWKLDGGTFASNGQSVPRAEYTQALPQASLTLGSHSVTVRACNSTVCGPETAFATFTVVAPIPTPGAVPGGGVRPAVAVVLNTNRGVDYAQARALWLVDRALTRGELDSLALRHPNAPLTKESIASIMDEAFAELVRR